MPDQEPLQAALRDFQAGRSSRRGFVQRLIALGVTAPVALALLRQHDAAAQDATPLASPEGSPTALVAPTGGTDGQTRGAGGELKILQWQASTTLNMHLAGSFKDQLAASLVTEPLIHFLQDGTPIPGLATEVPSAENGLLAADLSSVTYLLQEGILWGSGEPFTAKDRFNRPVLLFRSDWHLRSVEKDNPQLRLTPVAPMLAE